MPTASTSTTNSPPPVTGGDGSSRKRPLSARQSAPRPQKKRQKKKAPKKGTARAFPCRSCVTRAFKDPGHECVNQDNDGVACWDCSKGGHPCPAVPASCVDAVRHFWELNSSQETAGGSAWREAGNEARRQLRASGPAIGARPPTPAADLAPAAAAALGLCRQRGPSLEERSTRALESIAASLLPIAEAARLYNTATAKGKGKDEDEEDEDEYEDEEGEE
ncbi:hypothetical protein QBC46DRAFT_423972 [Diplogelasinospora grovesii]|uniref:Uncharacterized protein n=1 Tax=Diplogelasinospora grovesii TaxID=303347 RepID=A0AAN6S6G3_9PEZI|nr:hypothetical protein QBC46DRAFT_423972 [Diplogelasinospora grovesii]